MNKNDEFQSHLVYEFGNFRLDASRRLLFAKDSKDPLTVTPKVIAALLLFVEHSGELLTKDQLMADLWPGRVVEENSLTHLISVLRHLLGEQPGDNQYLSTVPGFGYRFIADVARQPASRTQQVTTQEIVTPVSIETTRRGRPALIALTASLAVSLLIYAWNTHWRQTDEKVVSDTVSPSASVALPPRTVAVLPFENLSADDNTAYVAFGMAESVLHRLASIRNLTVIARTSSFVFRDKTADARDIGRTLNARYLLEGSLQHSGMQLRVTAQLIDASNGAHVWSLRFDRTIDDIFAVEDEIAQAVAQALELSIDEREHPYAGVGTEAYLAFLQGRDLVASHTVADAERAIQRFSRAIEIAPDFAAAYVALADAHRHLRYLRAQPPGRTQPYVVRNDQDMLDASVREAEPFLAKALELDDSLGEAYVLRADLKAITEEIDGAEADYRKGLALSPNYGIGHQRFAQFLEHTGRLDEAFLELDKAILVDPLAPLNYYLKGLYYGEYSEETGTFGEKSETYFLKALEVDSAYYPALLRTGIIRWYQGRFAEAILLAEQAVAIDPHSNWLRTYLVEFYFEVGDVDAARSVLADQPDPVLSQQRLALCWYVQEFEQGLELLRAGSYRRFFDHDVEPYLIRDAALASGNPGAGRDELLAPHPIYDDFTFAQIAPYGELALAQLSLALGDRPEAERLAQEILAVEEHRLAYPRSAALVLLGQQDAAIDLLEESFALGYRRRWWYVFDLDPSRDPSFELLRSDPRFRALAVRAQEHAAAESERLKKMRERGEVPSRAIKVDPGFGRC